MVVFSFKLARVGKGLSIRRLGELIGVSKSMIVKMERSNRVPAERVLDLAEVLGVPPGIIRPDIYPKSRVTRVK